MFVALAHVMYLLCMVVYMYVCCLFQHNMLYRSDSADYRAQGQDMDSGVEAGSDMTPPTPAFPISPPTPYGERTLSGPFVIIIRFLLSENSILHAFVSSFVGLNSV